MSARWRGGPALVPIALLLAACAQTPEHAEPALVSAAVGEAVDIDNDELLPPAAPAVLPAATLRAALSLRSDALRVLLKQQIAGGDVTGPELRNDSVRMIWRGAALFDRASAELRPQALAGLGRAAKWLRADGASVLQVVGRRAAADSDELAPRRAAAVAAFIIAEGALPSRVRVQLADPTQLRGPRPAGADVDIALVVAPIVEGREVLAWVPPAVD